MVKQGQETTSILQFGINTMTVNRGRQTKTKI